MDHLPNPRSLTQQALLYLLAVALLPFQAHAGSELLVGNTRGSPSVAKYGIAEWAISEYIPDAAGLVEPDQLLLYKDYLYIAHGKTLGNSAIFRMSLTTMSYNSTFATGGGLIRPYGISIDESVDIMYVASFLSDQILMYDAMTGEYMGEFASGNGTEEGLCNGPNAIDILNGTLYMTTQGSEAVNATPQYNGLASQVVKYDLATGSGSVFIPQPDVLNVSLGFISMLGIQIGCGEESAVDGDCTVFTTDFGGGLRAYELATAKLIYAVPTTVLAGASTGSLTLSDNGMIYVPIFANESTGAVLRFDAKTGAPRGCCGGDAVYVKETSDLHRPVGILFMKAVETDATSNASFQIGASSYLLAAVLAVSISIFA
jgi:hypothetical protein